MTDMAMDGFLYIDGSQGEGGGQILRTSMALSAICKQPIILDNIRANRSKPGLRPQHLTGVKTMGELCQSMLQGAQRSSSQLSFSPETLPSGDHSIDIGTAGSTSLLLHALYFGFASSQYGGNLDLYGGTHADRAPTFDYLEKVWAPMLRLSGFQVELALLKHGFYPKGGGHIQAFIPSHSQADKIEPFHWLERPPLDRVDIRALWAEPKSKRSKRTNKIPERMASSAQKELAEHGISAELDIRHEYSLSPGAICHIICHFGPLRAGFTAWGTRGIPAEKIGAKVAAETIKFLQTDACLEEHAADQMLLPLALSGNHASFTTPRLSGHLETNATIIQKFFPKLTISFTPLDNQNICVEITKK